VPHTTNRAAFRDCDASNPCFRLYTLLVAIEFALKDSLATFPNGHDLTKLVPQVVTEMPNGLQAQLTSLDGSLRLLICTYKGSPVPVTAANYPTMRYLRHASDGHMGQTKDADIVQALNDAQQLLIELKRAGVEV
jgi:hypothetical protein